MKILIGIDTGVKTGCAVAVDRGNGGELKEVESKSITQAMKHVESIVSQWGKQSVIVYIEDPRMRTWFGSADARQARSGPGVREGVGSVKRDAQIWEDWCKENEINYKMIHPASNRTKLKVDQFERETGWVKRTNEHARDAAMLVFKRYWKV